MLGDTLVPGPEGVGQSCRDNKEAGHKGDCWHSYTDGYAGRTVVVEGMPISPHINRKCPPGDEPRNLAERKNDPDDVVARQPGVGWATNHPGGVHAQDDLQGGNDGGENAGPIRDVCQIHVGAESTTIPVRVIGVVIMVLADRFKSKDGEAHGEEEALHDEGRCPALPKPSFRCAAGGAPPRVDTSGQQRLRGGIDDGRQR